MSDEKRIAMWAVPRSMATALCRAWENRSDTVVFDEPLLGPYLARVGEDLGFTAADLAGSKKGSDYPTVIAELLAPLPPGKTICYQKHQPHNLLREADDMDWLKGMTNCFLIRPARDVLLSLHGLVPGVTLQQSGWLQLERLFDDVCKMTGSIPPIIDAVELQNEPRRTLALFCERVGVPFTAPFSEQMLSWPALDKGLLSEREQPWYSVAMQSTGFAPYRSSTSTLPSSLRPTLTECERIYARLYAHRLR